MFDRARSFLAGRYLVPVVVLGLAISLLPVLFSTSEPTHLDDGLRHMMLAEQIVERGIHGWQDYFFEGYFSDRDFDPWFLAHLTYLPFTIFEPLVGLKLMTLASIVALCVSFLAVLRSLNLSSLHCSLLLVFLVWGSTLFNWRILSGRPLVLSSALLLMVLWAIVGRKKLWLLVFLALSTLFSHLFVFIWLTALMGAVWLFFKKGVPRKESLTIMGVSILAPVLALLVHPWSELYRTYLKEVFFVIPFLKPLGLGTEFAPGFLMPDPSILLALGLTIWLGWGVKTHYKWGTLASSPTFLILLITCFFGACWLVWMRAVDFLWPVLLAALGGLLKLRASADDYGGVRKMLRTVLPVAILFCAVHWVSRWVSTVESGAECRVADYRLDVPSGSRVFNLDWEIFAPMVYHRPDLKYARGMDPTFDHIDFPARGKLLDQVFLDQDYLGWSAGLEVLMGSKKSLYPEENNELDADRWLGTILSEYRPDFVVLRAGRHSYLERYLGSSELVVPVRSPSLLRVYRVRGSQSHAN